MFRLKRCNPLFKCKQIYFLFIFLFSSLSNAHSQMSMAEGEMAVRTQDSLRNVQRTRDSINYQYVSNHPNAKNELLDSLKKIVLVDDNNFVGWIAKVNVLKAKNRTFASIIDETKVHRPAWLLVVVFGLFIGLGLVRFFFYVNFQNIVYGFYNSRVFNQLNKEDSLMTSWPYIFLYGIFSVSFGLLLWIFNSNSLQVGAADFVGFLKITLAIAFFFILKIVILRVIGILFEMERIVREYIVFLYLFYFNSVLILIPLLLIIVFLPVQYLGFVFILLLISVVILFFYRVLGFFLSLMSGGRFSIFYLILYICTLEIAPILILVKTLSK